MGMCRGEKIKFKSLIKEETYSYLKQYGGRIEVFERGTKPLKISPEYGEAAAHMWLGEISDCPALDYFREDTQIWYCAVSQG